MPEKHVLSVDNVTKSFDRANVLKDLSFTVGKGEIFFILGPSGCGKTTLLRMIAGFCRPDAGRILLEGEDITAVPPDKRHIGLVFQNYALWPHLSVWENVAYGLRVRKLPADTVRRKTANVLSVTQLASHKDKFPHQLSGGQQQRVALARALVIEPRVLLMDEPLSNLDAKLRDQMREEIRRIHRDTGLTMVYVTHDQKEALTLGTRIAVLNEGRIIQTGPPAQLYFRPRDAFVASFMGKMNFLQAKVIKKTQDGFEVSTSEGGFVVATEELLSEGQSLRLGFRPELPLRKGMRTNLIKGRIADTEYSGQTVTLAVETYKKNTFFISMLATRGTVPMTGDTIEFYVPPDELAVFRE